MTAPAREARMKVSPAFSKAAYVQGQRPCPRSAERGTSLVLNEAQEGV